MSRSFILPFIDDHHLKIHAIIIIDDGQGGALSKAGEIWQLDMSLIQIAFSEEKIDMLGGVEGFYIRPKARLGIPKIKMSDGFASQSSGSWPAAQRREPVGRQRHARFLLRR